MKQYKIYEHPQGNYEAVKQGWSWPAFLFSFIWAMVKKIWMHGAIYFTIVLVLILMLGDNIFVDIIAVIAQIIFGINGNKWRERNLSTRGYEYKEIVTAETSEEAIAHHIKNKENGHE